MRVALYQHLLLSQASAHNQVPQCRPILTEEGQLRIEGRVELRTQIPNLIALIVEPLDVPESHPRHIKLLRPILINQLVKFIV